MPYWTGAAFAFQIASPSTNAVYTPAGGVPFSVVANYGAPLGFPVQHNPVPPPAWSWQGFQVFGKTSFRLEHTLFVPGW